MHTSPEDQVSTKRISAGACLRLVAAGTIYIAFGTLGLVVAAPIAVRETYSQMVDRGVRLGIRLSGVPTR